MLDQLTVRSNRECARATDLRAKINMRVSRVQRCAGKKFYLPVALEEPYFLWNRSIQMYFFNR